MNSIVSIQRVATAGSVEYNKLGKSMHDLSPSFTPVHLIIGSFLRFFNMQAPMDVKYLKKKIAWLAFSKLWHVGDL
jgi:hypothetical protein